MKKIVYITITIIITITISLSMYGVFVRCLKFRTDFDYTDERNTIYKYDEELGWSGIPNYESFYKEIKVHNNSLGFRDIEHNYYKKDKKRILFIGDSFCCGYGVEQNKIFSELLRNKLTDYELFNCGISGYSTDQEYLLLQKYFNIIKPDIVFLIYCYNDDFESKTNIVHLGYYKPYYIKVGDKIKLQGCPVPKTWLYYKRTKSKFLNLIFELLIRLKNYTTIKNNDKIVLDILNDMKNFLTKNNCIFIIGSSNYNSNLTNIGDGFINLENSNKVDEFGHWNEQGHKYVADKIYDFLKDNKII